MDTLTKEQQNVITTLLEGHNVAMTGCGGTGKSHVIKQLATALGPTLEAKLGRSPNIHITALTGCAALLLGEAACTLHSWSGIGLGKEEVADLVWKIQRNGKAKRNWKNCDLLVIDEISMLTKDLLEKLDDIGRRMRRCDKPFGGIQLLLVGDFCQLPPVKELVFAFESARWSTIVPKVIELVEVQRQKDPVFQEILREARKGVLSKESEALLRTRMGLDWRGHKIRPTLLFPKNAEVDMINDANLKALKGPLKVLEAGVTYGDLKTAARTNTKSEEFKRCVCALDRDSSYKDKLLLAEGAQVMLITNLDILSGLVNGSRGVVVGFQEKDGAPMVEFLNGSKLPVSQHKWEVPGYPGVFRTQYPLRLAWACTIHKAQGATLDSALIDIGLNTFEYGQAYVALSRVKSLESLYIHDLNPKAFLLNPKVAAFYGF
jgi:ATP-dependent DNA helicase PIF1